MFSTVKMLLKDELKKCSLFYYIPLAALIAVYILAVFAFAKDHGLAGAVQIGMYSPLATMFLLILFLGWFLRWVFHVLRGMVRKEAHPLRVIGQSFLLSVKSCSLVEVVLPMVLLSLFNAANTAFKIFIGIINPFYLDPLFAEIDHGLHGGIEPWQITHSLVASTTGTMVVDLFYTAWLLVMWGFLYWQVLRVNDAHQRHQFFLSYVLCWAILGSVVAYLLSSAGPCYYGLLYNTTDIYAPLMERLYSEKAEVLSWGDWRDIWALNGQSYLWQGYTTAGVLPAGGISATPSLHVSMVVLFALSAWQVNRLFGWVMIAYALIILFGSVHLGWHYAIDGYLAIVMTIVIWLFAGWFLRHWARFVQERRRGVSDAVIER